MNNFDNNHTTNHADDGDDALNWVRSQAPRTELSSDPAAKERARNHLAARIVDADVKAKTKSSGFFHSWRLPPRRLVAAGALAAVVLATAVATNLGGVDGGGPSLAPAAANAAPLIALADDVAEDEQVKGDATMVIRQHAFPEDEPFSGFDLYLDSGPYYYGSTRAELNNAIKEGQNNDSYGALGLEAARVAAAGDVEKGRLLMVESGGGAPASELDAAAIENLLWMFSHDTLVAGAGRADVRAGVMKILATLPGVTITETEVKGRKVLELEVEFELALAKGQAGKEKYGEHLVIDAETGVPIRFFGGTVNESPSVEIDYEIKRVKFADIAG